MNCVARLLAYGVACLLGGDPEWPTIQLKYNAVDPRES